MVSVGLKGLVLIIVGVGAVVCLGTVFWTGKLFPSRVEKISFLSCDWSSDKSEVGIYIANTGSDELIVDKVWINGTLIDVAEWEIFPSMRLESGNQGVLHLTPSSVVFVGGKTYEFTLGTAGGNLFSYTAVNKTYTFMKTEELKIQSHTWAVSRTSISLTVKNTGTNSFTIVEWRVNDVAVSNVTYTSGSATLNAGETATVRVAPPHSTFASGVRYEFAALTATGNKYTYVATAP